MKEGRPLNGKWLQMVCPTGDGKRRKWQLRQLRLSNSPYANSIILLQWRTVTGQPANRDNAKLNSTTCQCLCYS